MKGRLVISKKFDVLEPTEKGSMGEGGGRMESMGQGLKKGQTFRRKSKARRSDATTVGTKRGDLRRRSNSSESVTASFIERREGNTQRRSR